QGPPSGRPGVYEALGVEDNRGSLQTYLRSRRRLSPVRQRGRAGRRYSHRLHSAVERCPAGPTGTDYFHCRDAYFGGSDPRYAEIEIISSSESLSTTFFISAASLPPLAPFCIQISCRAISTGCIPAIRGTSPS